MIYKTLLLLGFFLFTFIKSSLYLGEIKNRGLNYESPQTEINQGWSETIKNDFKKGDSLYITQDYAQAMPYFMKIDSLSAVLNKKNEITIKAILRRAEISKLTFTKESSEIAYQLGKVALKNAQEINSLECLNLSYVKLADFCQLTKRYDEAKLYIDNALGYYLAKSTNSNEEEGWISRLYLIESAYYLEQNNPTKGRQSRYKAVSFLEGKNNDSEMAKAKYYYGHYLRYDKKDYTTAIGFLEDSKSLYKKTENTENEVYHRCLRDLAICYSEIGDFNKSSQYYKEAYNLKIKLNKKANRNFSRNLETKYLTEKKEQEITLLKSQKQLTEEKQKNQRNILLSGIGLTSIAGLFLFMLYKNRKKTTDKLKQLDSAKSKFFTNISHEFRTPLTLISNPIEEILEDKSISDKQRQQFNMAKRNSDRLLSLVNQLLDLSKIDAGKLKLQIQKGNLKQLISALSDSFSYQANKKHINYSVIIDNQGEPEVYFDKDAIEKIVVNLISNAIKYAPENGAASFKAEVKNNTLVIEVKNTGTGLKEEQLSNIFQRFYQTSEDNIGSGVGLALVKELVDLHKGQIHVDSVPNKWTTFKITLPVGKSSFKKEAFIIDSSINSDIKNSTPVDQISENVEDDTTNSNQPVLLIVEDNPDLRTLLKQTFENNYNILTASNGEEGSTVAIEHIPDIIISDIMMPLKNGIELTKELKNDVRTSHIPIILLTAKAGEDNELKGVETGADDYMTKPFSSKILIAKVSKLLEVREKLQQRYSQEVILRPKDLAINNIDEEFLEKIQTVMDEQLVESTFNIQAFCQGVGMSRMQLHRKIKALTGLSTSEFIRSQRLKLAAELLKKTDVNVSEIGYAVGFNDRSYFTKCFREAFGSAPTTYAKKFAK